jgi:DNA-binding MarR family transcriptional regulator
MLLSRFFFAHRQTFILFGGTDVEITLNIFEKPVDKIPAIVYIHIMSEKLDLLNMQNCVSFNLRRATRAVTQFFDTELRRHGIRSTQTPILTALAAKPEWSMEELSGFLGMERTTLVRNLRPLERDEWVHVAGGGRGSRVALSITAKGRQELKKFSPAWESAQQAIIKTLGEQRWSAILADLERAVSALNKS